MDIASLYLNNSIVGWQDMPSEKEIGLRLSKTPVYRVAAAEAMKRPVPTRMFLGSVFLRAMRKIAGSSWKWKPQYQNRGTCVSQSHKVIADIIMALNYLLNGKEFLGRASCAVIYALSRVEVGRQPGRWDGSTGTWASRALLDYGVGLLKDIGVGEDDMRTDEAKAVEWAASSSGVPSTFETLAKNRPIEKSSMVSSIAEVIVSLANWNLVNLCGSWHPSQTRNTDGVSRCGSGGGHSTCLLGYEILNTTKTEIHPDELEDQKDNILFWHLQSWGDYYNGPTRLRGADEEQFKSSVTSVRSSDMGPWLRTNDCYNFAGVNGFNPLKDPNRI